MPRRRWQMRNRDCNARGPARSGFFAANGITRAGRRAVVQIARLIRGFSAPGCTRRYSGRGVSAGVTRSVTGCSCAASKTSSQARGAGSPWRVPSRKAARSAGGEVVCAASWARLGGLSAYRNRLCPPCVESRVFPRRGPVARGSSRNFGQHPARARRCRWKGFMAWRGVRRPDRA